MAYLGLLSLVSLELPVELLSLPLVLFDFLLLLDDEEPLESLPMLLEDPLLGVALESEPEVPELPEPVPPEAELLPEPELPPLEPEPMALPAELPPLLEPEPVLLDEPDCAIAGNAANASMADP
jgi:hypothetical protein